MAHLQKLVTCAPQQMIGKFDAVDENYELALEILENEYNRPDRVLSEVHHAITSLSQARNHPESLKHVFYELEGLLATFKNSWRGY